MWAKRGDGSVVTQSGEGYEPARLRRAAVLDVVPVGPQQYRVRGQQERYYDVDLSAEIPCYCKDAEFHGRGCKHELAARLFAGDQALRIALGTMLLEVQRRNDELQRRMNRRKAS